MSAGIRDGGEPPWSFSADLARSSRHRAPRAPDRDRHRRRRRRLRGAGRGGDPAGPASRRQPCARRLHDRGRRLVRRGRPRRFGSPPASGGRARSWSAPASRSSRGRSSRRIDRCRSRSGWSSLGIPAAVLAHLVLAFPDGRLHSIWERLDRRRGLPQRDRGPGRDAHVHGRRAGRRLPVPAQPPVRPRRHGRPHEADEHRAVHRASLSRQPSSLVLVLRWRRRLASAQARALPDPGQRRCGDRAARGDAARELAALHGRSDQAPVRGAIGVRRRADRLSRRAVPRTHGPRRSQRPDRGAGPRTRARTAARRHRSRAARSLARARLLDPRPGRVRGRRRTAPFPSFRLPGVR